MLGHLTEFHYAGRVEGVHALQTVDSGYAGPLSGIDEDGISGQLLRTAISQLHFQRLWTGESSFAKDQIDAWSLFDTLLASVAPAGNYVALALANHLHIDANWTSVYAVVCRAPGEIGHSRAGNHGLGWCAALVDAGAPNVFALDDGGFAPRSGQLSRDWAA